MTQRFIVTRDRDGVSDTWEVYDTIKDEYLVSLGFWDSFPKEERNVRYLADKIAYWLNRANEFRMDTIYNEAVTELTA